MTKTIGFLFLSLGISFATLLFFKPSLLDKDLEAEVIGKMWQQDINKLIEANHLPPTWHQIKEIKIRAHSDKTARWLRSIKPPVNLNHKGRYLLEITMDHNEEKESLAVITQYNLVDLKSKNTLWEFGRTYVLPNRKWLSKGQKVLSFLSSLKGQKKTQTSMDPKANQKTNPEAEKKASPSPETNEQNP